jgi:alkylation response protein AidB-like acyl-CoA dehydrogenase
VAAAVIDIVTASMPKCRVTDSEGKIVDGGLQLSGGYGYMDSLAPH